MTIVISLTHTYQKLIELVVILYVLFILLCISFTKSMCGYELSLHVIYPPWVWVLFICVGLSPLVYSFITSKLIGNYCWKTACVCLVCSIFSSCIFKYLPLIRGYSTFSQGDTLTHFGLILDILNSGHIPMANHYPYVHVFSSVIVSVLNVPKELVLYNLSVLFYLFYVLSIMVIVKSIFSNRKYIIVLLSLISLPLAMGELLTPSGCTFYLIFFYIYLVYKSIFSKNKSIYLCLSILFTIVCWYIHPEFVVYSIILITIMCAMHSFNMYSCCFKSIVAPIRSIFPFMCVLLLLFIGFIYVFSQKPAFLLQLNSFENIIFGMESGQLSSVSLSMSLSFQELIATSCVMYGYYLFPILLCVCVCLYYVLHIRWKNISNFNKYLIISFIGYAIFSLVNMISGTAIGALPVRMLTYCLCFSWIMLSSFGIMYLLSKPITFLKKFFILSLIFTVVVVSTITPVMVAYGNPDLKSFNSQVSEQNIAGAKLFFETRSIEYLVNELSSKQFQSRYYQYLYGSTIPNQGITNLRGVATISNSYYKEKMNDFGYDLYLFAGTGYTSNIYQVIYQPFGFLHNRYVIPSRKEWVGGVSPIAYLHFNFDMSVNKLFNFGDFEVHMIIPYDDPH